MMEFARKSMAFSVVCRCGNNKYATLWRVQHHQVFELLSIWTYNIQIPSMMVRFSYTFIYRAICGVELEYTCNVCTNTAYEYRVTNSKITFSEKKQKQRAAWTKHTSETTKHKATCHMSKYWYGLASLGSSFSSASGPECVCVCVFYCMCTHSLKSMRWNFSGIFCVVYIGWVFIYIYILSYSVRSFSIFCSQFCLNFKGYFH